MEVKPPSLSSTTTSTTSSTTTTNQEFNAIENATFLKQSSEWVLGLCVVDFDLELGQKIEHLYPPLHFEEEDATNICFSSFPDSHTTSEGHVVYSFRIIPHIPDSSDHQKPKSTNTTTTPTPTTTTPTPTPTPPVKFDELFGHVFFKQRKDASIRRGFMQKSVVILTRVPFFGLFQRSVELVGPLYFEYGRPLLEASFQTFADWPSYLSSHMLELPVAGELLRITMPERNYVKLIETNDRNQRKRFVEQRFGSEVGQLDLYFTFHNILPRLWNLWEMILVQEPILVLSKTPAESCDAVLGLISLIEPMSFVGDFRPYFTIHDSSFKLLSTCDKNSLPSGTIIGVTNPFFEKAFENFSHKLFLGSPLSGIEKFTAKVSETDIEEELNRSMDPSASPKYRHKNARMSLLSPEKKFKQKFTTDWKPFTNVPDIISKLNTKAKTLEESMQNSKIIRTHFLEITTEFLSPLENYFTKLLPTVREISLWRRPPRIKPFKETEFLEFVSTNTTLFQYFKTTKEKMIAFYQRFLRTKNFENWLLCRTIEANQRMNNTYLEKLKANDLSSSIKNRKESEVVDLFFRIEDLKKFTAMQSNGEKVIAILKQHQDVISNEVADHLKPLLVVQKE